MARFSTSHSGNSSSDKITPPVVAACILAVVVLLIFSFIARYDQESRNFDGDQTHKPWWKQYNNSAPSEREFP